MTKPQPLHIAQSRQREANKRQLLAEVELALVHAVQGVSIARMKCLQSGNPRSSDSGTGMVRQALRVLGIDPTDADELRSLKKLGDRILDDETLYSTVMWQYYCRGYVSFNECQECREKTGDRRRFFSEGQAAIERRFTELVNQRGFRPPKAPKN